MQVIHIRIRTVLQLQALYIGMLVRTVACCNLCTANLELFLQGSTLFLYLFLHTSHELKVEMTQVPQFPSQFGAA